jgi:hypothetical protein
MGQQLLNFVVTQRQLVTIDYIYTTGVAKIFPRAGGENSFPGAGAGGGNQIVSYF